MTTGTDLPANTTHGSRGCFLNNWWNAKLWTLRSTPITQIAGHSSMNPCNWPEKLLFTLSLSSPKQGPLFQVDWCALSLWTDPLNPRPFPSFPSPLGLGLISWSNRRPLKSFLTVSVWASVVGWSLSLSLSSLSSSALVSSDWWWHSCGFI